MAEPAVLAAQGTPVADGENELGAKGEGFRVEAHEHRVPLGSRLGLIVPVCRGRVAVDLPGARWALLRPTQHRDARSTASQPLSVHYTL